MTRQRDQKIEAAYRPARPASERVNRITGLTLEPVALPHQEQVREYTPKPEATETQCHWCCKDLSKKQIAAQKRHGWERLYCSDCIKQGEEHARYEADLQASYEKARQERLEQQQREYQEWREKRYQERCAEQEEQHQRRDEYRTNLIRREWEEFEASHQGLDPITYMSESRAFGEWLASRYSWLR